MGDQAKGFRKERGVIISSGSGDIIADAKRYRAELGVGVVPAHPEKKKPKMKGWQRGGLRSLDSIEKVFGRYVGDVAISIPTGRAIEGGGFLYVLDVDNRHGGREALSALPEIPETVTARTGGGRHYWFRTSTPLPSIRRKDGLELKGAGSQVVVPPAPGRSWLRSPFEWDIAECPDWLLPRPDETAESRPLPVEVNQDTGEVTVDLSDPLGIIRRAKRGSRHETLLHHGGRVGFRMRAGLISEDTARRSLLDAASETGLDQTESLRVINYLLLSSRGGTGERLKPIVVTGRERDVLRVVDGHFRSLEDYYRLPFERLRADVLSTRYVAEKAGLRHPPQAARSMEKLRAAGYVWRSPRPKMIGAGPRPCFMWRITYLGRATATL